MQGNILVLTPWSYKDALIQTYTLPYVNIIRNILPAHFKIILVTEEQPQVSLSQAEQENLNKEWASKNMRLVALPYHHFGWKKMIAWIGQVFNLLNLIRKEKISVIHAFCTPAGSVGFLLSKLSRKPLIVDSYEPHAESMVENGTWKRSGIAFKILFRLEKWQTKTASHLIGTTRGMLDYAKQKYGTVIKSFYIKPACVDLEKFRTGNRNEELICQLRLKNKIIGFYAGKIGGIYLDNELFDFIKACYEFWGDRFRFVMLTNTSKREIGRQLERISLPPDVLISKFVYHDDVPRYMGMADFAINPVKPVPSKRYCTSIKDGEYWAMGLPVIISPGISDDSDIIQKENAGIVIDFYEKETFYDSLKKLEAMIADKQTLQKRIRVIAEKHRSFAIAEKVYEDIYSGK